jgi:hypothetical protein
MSFERVNNSKCLKGDVGGGGYKKLNKYTIKGNVSKS